MAAIKKKKIERVKNSSSHTPVKRRIGATHSVCVWRLDGGGGDGLPPPSRRDNKSTPRHNPVLPIHVPFTLHPRAAIVRCVSVLCGGGALTPSSSAHGKKQQQRERASRLAADHHVAPPHGLLHTRWHDTHCLNKQKKYKQFFDF